MMCPWKLGQGHRNIKKLYKLSQRYAQTTSYWFIRYHAFTQEREWGEWYANINIVADKIRTKICPTSSWVGGDQKSSLCLRQTKPNVAALKNGRKGGNKTEFCYHWVQYLTKCWSTFFPFVLKITVYPLRTYMYMIYYDLCPHFL